MKTNQEITLKRTPIYRTRWRMGWGQTSNQRRQRGGICCGWIRGEDWMTADRYPCTYVLYVERESEGKTEIRAEARKMTCMSLRIYRGEEWDSISALVGNKEMNINRWWMNDGRRRRKKNFKEDVKRGAEWSRNAVCPTKSAGDHFFLKPRSSVEWMIKRGRRMHERGRFERDESDRSWFLRNSSGCRMITSP